MAKRKRRQLKSGKNVACDERAVVCNDFHVPYADSVAVELLFDFLRWFKPDTLFVNGDLCDFYAVSRYSKDPQRLLSLQEELDQANGLLRRFRKALPEARIVYLEGNHEHRLLRYLWDHPELSTLNNLQLPALLGLGELEIEHYSYHEPQQWRGLIVEHGCLARAASASTAKGMLERRGTSGISGHTHRLGAFYRTDHTGTQAWFENGCFCDLAPTYMIGRPNWQQGFSVAYGWENRFIVEQLPIFNRRLFYQGILWER